MTDWTNQLYFGDNLGVLRNHIPDESVDLIYLDPPFNSNATYNVLFKERSGEESAAQITAFDDTWHWTIESERAYQEVVTQGAVADIVPRTLAAQDWTISTLSWESPFDPDPVLRPTFEGLQNWMYGSPEGGPRTGRASVDEYPNDQVLADIRATEELVGAAAIPAIQESRVPLYAKVFEGEEDHMFSASIAQWPANWVAQPHVENFEIIPFLGFPRGMSFKGIWFNDV